MMRLTTPGNLRLQQSRELSVNYGGSEANVAISVANFGGQVDYVTRLPENPLGEACIAELRSHNIGTDHILTGGKRLGTYYMEKAAAMRNSRVIYDREGSSFSELEPGMINWKEIFSDAGLFHWSGIDAALTPGLAEVCREAVETAREMGISVSYDINYRKNLWKYGKTAQEVLRPLIASSDIMFGSEGEYAMLFGLKAPGFKATSAAGRYDTAAYETFCREIAPGSAPVPLHLHRPAQRDELRTPHLRRNTLCRRHHVPHPRVRHQQCHRLCRSGRRILRCPSLCPVSLDRQPEKSGFLYGRFRPEKHHLRRLQHGQGFRSGGTDGPQRKGGTGKIIKKGENQHERVPASPARHPLMSAISSVHETLANDIFQ